jgi:hypothetical protein
MATKREYDALYGEIANIVAKSHESTGPMPNLAGPDVGGEDAGSIIAESDYGFDEFKDQNSNIKDRSRAISKKSLEVHGKPGGGEDNSTKGDFGLAVKNKNRSASQELND